jgi:hypothetical protein
MTLTRTSMTVEQRLVSVRERIARACDRAGRNPESVTLVGVSKTFPVEIIATAVQAGLADLGENRVQEGAPKVQALADRGLRPTWHLVGHLQTNKVKTAIKAFDIIHSVDSIRLAETIDRIAERVVPVFIEVNISGEASKEGVAQHELEDLLERARRLARVQVLGLMTVAPMADDPEDVRPIFRQLRALASAHGLQGLSMGMTGDFEVAIEEGATHVRVGRAIFGERPA